MSQSLSTRMTIRRYTRLTNAFSKKIENHAAAVVLSYFAYNFIKIHRTLRCIPAMAAGVMHRRWEVSDLVGLWETEGRTASHGQGRRRTRNENCSGSVGNGEAGGTTNEGIGAVGPLAGAGDPRNSRIRGKKFARSRGFLASIV